MRDVIWISDLEFALAGQWRVVLFLRETKKQNKKPSHNCLTVVSHPSPSLNQGVICVAIEVLDMNPFIHHIVETYGAMVEAQNNYNLSSSSDFII